MATQNSMYEKNRSRRRDAQGRPIDGSTREGFGVTCIDVDPESIDRGRKGCRRCRRGILLDRIWREIHPGSRNREGAHLPGAAGPCQKICWDQVLIEEDL